MTHIEDTGDVYIQFQSLAVEILNEQMASLGENNSLNYFAKACDIKRTPQQLYLAMYSVDDCFYRAIIEKETAFSKEVNILNLFAFYIAIYHLINFIFVFTNFYPQVEVRFVDYGNTEKVKTSELLVIDNTYSELLKLPFQVRFLNTT